MTRDEVVEKVLPKSKYLDVWVKEDRDAKFFVSALNVCREELGKSIPSLLWIAKSESDIIAFLGQFIDHYYCEDTWYQCRAVGGCNDNAGPEGVCSCGRDEQIKELAHSLIEWLRRDV